MLKKIRDIVRWAQGNWPVLLFWLACAIGGWYLGAKGYGMALYFRLTGINPEEWPPPPKTDRPKRSKGRLFCFPGRLDRLGRQAFQTPFPREDDRALVRLW